jgi:type II secretory pathway component PulJ
MKISIFNMSRLPGVCRASLRGLSIVEMMITMTIFSFVTLAMVYVHIFGLKQDQLVESKLGASDQSRKAFEKLSREIRTAQTFDVGAYSGGTNFTLVPTGASQIGTGLRIQYYLAANGAVQTNIYYYFNTNSLTLWRFHTGDASPTLVATNLDNIKTTLQFVAEDQQGNVITDQANRRLVHFTMGFRQYQYPTTIVGSNSLYDYYKMEFRITPHVPQSP